mgnify:CR=1 FL=1
MACPMGKQQIRITAGTKIRYRQMFRKDSCIPQHNLITLPTDPADIFHRPFRSGSHTHDRKNSFANGRCHIFTYFITVLTDGRSNGGKNFSGVTMKFPAHHLDGMLPHASDRPLHRNRERYRLHGVWDLQNKAVHSQRKKLPESVPVHPSPARPHPCKAAPLSHHSPAASIHPPDIRRMGLIRTDNIRKRSSHCLCHSAVVFRHCLRIISTC